MIWGDPADIRLRLLGRWEKGLLRELYTGELAFPFRIPLKRPSAAQMSSCFEDVRLWSESLVSAEDTSPWVLERQEQNHRQLGRNALPSALVFQTRGALLSFLGRKKEFEAYRMAVEKVKSLFPELESWCLEKPGQLPACEDELDRVLRILQWVRANPRPGLYLRQISLEGVDTKFIENHRGLLMRLLDQILDPGAIREEFRGVGNFEKRYGFLSRPELVRFRFPGGECPDGFSDMTVRADEFCRTPQPVKRIFVVENDITALAFPPVPDSLVLFGRGYTFDPLAGASWMREKDIFYWGDLDTHGLAILGQFRSFFSESRSLLMDRQTLLANKAHWGYEEQQSTRGDKGLTSEEAELMEELKNGCYGKQVRLEQEFIPFSAVEQALSSL